MRELTKIESNLHNACGKLADESLTLYTRQISPVLYLYGYKGQPGIFTEFKLCRERPRFFEIVILTHVPRDKDRDGLRYWFREHLRREPCIPALERMCAEKYTLKDKSYYRRQFDGSLALFTSCWNEYRRMLKGSIDDPTCDADVNDWLGNIASGKVNNPRSKFYIYG